MFKRLIEWLLREPPKPPEPVSPYHVSIVGEGEGRASDWFGNNAQPTESDPWNDLPGNPY